MFFKSWFLATLFMGGTAAHAIAPMDAPVDACESASVRRHVIEQFREFGPRSKDHEYFAFVYRHAGVLSSAVIRSSRCRGYHCTIDTAKSLASIPRGGDVVGEWHTHPHVNGSGMLSADDVRGAYRNRHLPCYSAYYSRPDGAIFTWNPRWVSVPTALASRVMVGNYVEDRVDAAII